MTNQTQKIPTCTKETKNIGMPKILNPQVIDQRLVQSI